MITLFVAVVAGLLGTPYWLLVPAMAGTVVTWDVGENAIGIAEQFPGDGTTWRGETLHATVSALLVTVFAVAATAAYSYCRRLPTHGGRVPDRGVADTPGGSRSMSEKRR